MTIGDLSPILMIDIIRRDDHAITQDFDAPFLIATGEIMEGEFPQKAKALVKEFILRYQMELLSMWETEVYKKLPPLD